MDKYLGSRYIGGVNRKIYKTKTGYMYYKDKGRKIITTLKPISK